MDARPRRVRGMPVAGWLVVGFALVIAAFVTGSVLAQRSVRSATQDVATLLREFEPVSRRARDLREGVDGFDHAVLEYVRDGSPANLEVARQAAARLAATAGGTRGPGGPPTPGDHRDRLANPLLAALLTAHQANGFRLIDLQQQRRDAQTRLGGLLAALDQRVRGTSAREFAARGAPTGAEIADLAGALDSLRAELLEGITAGASVAAVDPPATALDALAGSLQDAAAGSHGAPGFAWLELVDEEYREVLKARRDLQRIDRSIEAARGTFLNSGQQLSAALHEHVETPAWDRLQQAAGRVRTAVQHSEQAITTTTIKAIMLALLALSLTAWMITVPVRRLTMGTRRIASGDLAARVRGGGARELDELATNFNDMAAALDRAERAVRSYQTQLEQRVAERTVQLRHLAGHDPLTNLPNRRQLFERLEELIERPADGSRHIAVLFLDLDNFKSVNDSLGHEFGDRALVQIGERLRQSCPEDGFIARLGGDEFTLVFGFDGAVEDVEQRASALVSQFQRPFVVDRRELSIGVSCGAALFPDHGRDAASLLRAADAALFRAKELGRNRLCIYDPGLLVAATNRFRAEQALRRAIDAGQLCLHFQPQVSLGSLATTSVEALLRWRQGPSEMVPAAEFIGVAEQSGLILDLSDWVLEQAAQAAAEWRRAGWTDARVSVNVSAQQFVGGRFPARIEELLGRYALPPDALELELTENMLQTGAITVQTLRELRRLGVATALDDFGTGYSSLTSLEQLPLSRVKLDRSVIAEVDWNPRAASIAYSIVTLCRSLGLQVTVEGVERPNQLDFLAGCGDVAVQGFLIGHPVTLEHVTEYVAGTAERLGSLLEAAQLVRVPASEDAPDGPVRLVRRRGS